MAAPLIFGIRIKLDGTAEVVNGGAAVSGALEGIGRQAARTAQSGNHLSESLSRIAQYGLGGLGLAAGIGSLIRTADAMTNLESRLKLVTSGHNELYTAQSAVYQIAQSTRSSLEATGDLYYKMSKGAQALGMSQAQVARLTETIGQAMTLSGSSAESAKAALVQFGQALSSGVLRGEELNSVMEQAPALAEAIASGMGKSVGELRLLGETGQLTVQQLMGALEKSAPEVARQFATLAPTIQGSYQMLSNASSQFVAQLDKQSGSSHALASSIQFVANNLQAFTAVAAVTASVGLGGLIGKQALAIQASVARAAALQVEAAATRTQIAADLAHARSLEATAVARLSAATAERAQLAAMSIYGPARARVEREIAAATALRAQSQLAATGAEGRLAAATVGSTTAMTGARAVMGALGGPIGLVTTLLLAGAAAWSMFGESATDAGQKSAEALAKFQQDELSRGRDPKEGLQNRIADIKRTEAIAFGEYHAATTPSEKSAIWKKYNISKLSADIYAAEEEIKKIEEREKNLAAKIAGMSTSDKWQKAHLSPEQKKQHDLKELDKDYAAETAKFIGSAEQQLKLAREYQEKRAVILSKGEKTGKSGKSGSEKGFSDAATEQARDYAQIIKSSQDYTAQLEAEFEGGEKLTKSAKLLAEAREKLPAPLQAIVASELDWAATLEARMAVQNRDFEANKATQKMREDAVAGQNRLESERTAALDKAVAATQADLDKQREAFETYGLSESAIRNLTVAKLEAKLAGLDFAASTVEEVDALEKQIAALKEAAGFAAGIERRAANSKAVDSSESDRNKQREAYETYGLSEAAIRNLTVAKLEAKLAGLDFAAATGEEVDALIDNAKALEKQIALGKEAASFAARTEQARAYEQIIKSSQDYTAQLEAEFAGGEKLTKSAELLAAAREKLTPQQQAMVAAELDWAAALKASIAIEKLDFEALKGTQKMREDAVAGQARLESERTAALDKAVAATQADLDKQREAFETYGLSESAIRNLTAAKLEAKLAGLDFATATVEEVDALEKQIAALKEASVWASRTESKAATKKAADDANREWEKFYDGIQQGLTDSLYRGFESGKGFGESFVSSLRNTLKSASLKIAVTAIVDPIMGNARAVGNAVFGGSGNGLLGSVSNGSSLYSGLSGSNGYAAQAGAWLDGAMGTGATGSQGFMLMQQGAAFEGSQAAMLAAQTAEFGEAGVALTNAAAGAGTGMAEGFLAAIPGWGWALGGALALAGASGVFDSKGGPKTAYAGGSPTAAFGAVHAANMGYAPIDANVTSAVNTGIAAYQSTVAQFGGTAKVVILRASGDSDPNGTARDSAGTSLMIDGQLHNNYQNFDRGQGQAAIPGMISRAILDALQRTDMSPVANAIVRGLDPAKIVDAELEEVNRALAGAAALFGGSPLEAAIAGARGQMDALRGKFTDLGVAGGLSTQALREAVQSLDLTGDAGASAARKLAALAPEVRAYEDQLLGLIGTSRDGIKSAYLDAIKSSPDAASAGEKFAQTVMDGFNNTILDAYAGQITDIMVSGIFTPIINAAITQQGVTEALSQATIDAAVKRATTTMEAFSVIWNNKDFQAGLARIKQTVADLATKSVANLPTTPGVFFDSSKQAIKDAETAREKAQKDAEQAAEKAADLAKKRREMEIQVLELQGKKSEALAAQRKLELEQMDASLRPLQERINLLSDERARADRLLGAQRALVDGQVDLISRIYDAYKGAVSFRDGLDDKILSLRQADPSFDSAGYWSGQIDKAGAEYQKLIHADTRDTPESLQRQLELGQQIEKGVMGRYEAELAALRRTTDATRALAQSSVDLRKYVESLRTGDLSPATAGARLAESRSQYEKTLNIAKGGDYEKTLKLANGGDINAQRDLSRIMEARSDLSRIADIYLKQNQSYYGGASKEYRQVFADAVTTIEGLAQPGRSTEQLLADIRDADINYNAKALVLSQSAEKWLTAIKSETERRMPEIAGRLLELSRDLDTYLGSNSPLIKAITGTLPQQLATLIGRPALGDAPLTISGPDVSDDALREAAISIWPDYNGDSNAWAHEVYRLFRAGGVSSARAARVLGVKQEDILQWAEDNDLPAFAAGADRLPADMLALVHEDERIIPAADNRRLLAMLERPATDGALALMIDRLNAQIAGLRQDARLIGDAQVRAVIESAEAIPQRIAAANDRLHRSDWVRGQA